jgi:uncharacterized protein (DUF488 family)
MEGTRPPEAASGAGEVYSIGHSNQPLEHFLGLLARYQIEVIADVRSVPWSRYVPWAARAVLEKELARRGIRYVYLGVELGGRPRGPEYEGITAREELYRKIESSDAFRAGIERLIRGARQYRVAMLCSEENPAICHRDRLIRPVLVRLGLSVHHIRADGTLGSHLPNEQGQPSRPELPGLNLFCR